MDFAEAWEAFEVGSSTTVSNGQIKPTGDETTLAFRVWRSHNFAGTVAEKIEGEPRSMRIEFENDAGNLIGYTIREGDGHSFAAT